MIDRTVFLHIASAFSKDDIDKIVSKDEVETKLGICGYCNQKVATIPYKKVIKPTLKEKYWFPECKGFCRECAFGLKNPIFRRKTFLYSKSCFKTLQHAEIWSYLLSPIFPPFFLSLTTTHKKHNVIYGEMNYIPEGIRKVVLDQQYIQYSTIDDHILFESVDLLYNRFRQNKSDILSGEYRVSDLSNNEYDKLKKIDGMIKEYRGSLLMVLAVTYVQKQEG